MSRRVLLLLLLVPACRTESPRPAPSVEPPASVAPATPSLRESEAAAPPSTPSGGPPALLSCLVRHYAGRAVEADGAWWLELPGARVAFTGPARSLEVRQDAPFVTDVFSPTYRPGPIRPVTDPEEDPGRARIEAPFRRVVARLDALPRSPALADFGGTFNWRAIAGTERRSAHAWGIAIDLNPAVSDYWRNGPLARPVYNNRIPQAIVDAFEAEGFAWGGRWFHYDTMHFEYRPELFDPACR